MRITINTGNAAFHDLEDNGGSELEAARILRGLADWIVAHGMPEIGGLPLRDINGLTVGKAEGR